MRRVLVLLLLAGCSTPPAPRPAPPSDGWGAEQHGLSTRLVLLDSAPRVGGPLRVRLLLRNRGARPAVYDAQQAGINGSLDVEGPSSRYIFGSHQTSGQDRRLDPGEEVVLFESLDVAEQYLIAGEGTYRIRFSGRGLDIHPGESDPELRRDRSEILLVSNEVRVEVGPGKRPTWVEIGLRCEGVLPEGWSLSVHRGEGARVALVTLTRVHSMKDQLAWISVAIGGESPGAGWQDLGESRWGRAFMSSTHPIHDHFGKLWDLLRLNLGLR